MPPVRIGSREGAYDMPGLLRTLEFLSARPLSWSQVQGFMYEVWQGSRREGPGDVRGLRGKKEVAGKCAEINPILRTGGKSRNTSNAAMGSAAVNAGSATNLRAICTYITFGQRDSEITIRSISLPCARRVTRV